MMFVTKMMKIEQVQSLVSENVQTPYIQFENTYYVELECDTEEDLPSITVNLDIDTMKGTINLIMGSKAHVISTNKDYKLKSDGTWVEQTGTDILSLVNAISQVEDDLQDTAADASFARSAIDYFIRPKIGEIIDTVGMKNLVKFTFTSPYTNQNVTYTNNGDGTVSLSGTSTGFSYVNVSTINLKAGETLHLNGCPEGGSYTSTYCLYIAKNVSGAATLAHEEGENLVAHALALVGEAVVEVELWAFQADA